MASAKVSRRIHKTSLSIFFMVVVGPVHSIGVTFRNRELADGFSEIALKPNHAPWEGEEKILMPDDERVLLPAQHGKPVHIDLELVAKHGEFVGVRLELEQPEILVRFTRDNHILAR